MMITVNSLPASGEFASMQLGSKTRFVANTQLKQQEVEGVMTWMPHGNSSEAPLVVAAAKAGIWEDYVAQEYPRVVEFGSMQLGSKTRFVASVKGAPNYILKNCTRFCQTDGSIVTLTDEQRNEIMEAVDDLSSQGASRSRGRDPAVV
ncbi:hypothetical protein P43SY_010664 [Pythium insidiosum]|uniref:Uncharacterized protein n=1 Tax=Pythium insidiosum TaxID=114742 RepID=A0AAD5LZ00_PYTIN|nr:hypothetical protein P43SY_010664 [Pythium insidiosum]